MKKILMITWFFFAAMSVANASMFDDLVNDVKEAMKAKEMARVELPLQAIKKQDPRIKKIESLAVQVAMKHKWNLQVACPDDRYCSSIKKAIDKEAWRIARSKVSSDYAAKAKLPKIQMVRASKYHIKLMKKGI